jgi:hypothetical protein
MERDGGPATLLRAAQIRVTMLVIYAFSRMQRQAMFNLHGNYAVPLPASPGLFNRIRPRLNAARARESTTCV